MKTDAKTDKQRLIAELLAALKAAKTTLTASDQEKEHPIVQSTLRKICDAIAKAEGRQS